MSSVRPNAYRIVAVAIGMVAFIVVAAKAFGALLVLFGGYLFALVLRGLAGITARFLRLPYLLCVTIVVVILLAAAVMLVVSAGPKLVDQVAELERVLPAAINDLLGRVRRASGQTIGPSVAVPGPNSETLALGAFAALSTSLEFIGGLVVIFFVGLYGAARPSDYSRVVLSIVPRGRGVRALRIVRNVNRNLTRWLLGRLVAMVFVGVACAIAFAAIGLPLAMSLAVLAGLLTFVEYVGAVISAIPPLVLALTQGTTTALLVLVTYTVLHVIEGYVLTPLLARASVRFPPGVTLSGQIVLATLIGPLGLTFSTPLLIVLASVVKGTTARPQESDVVLARRASTEPVAAHAGG